MANSFPRSFCISFSVYFDMSVPFTRILPARIRAVDGSSFIMVLHRTLFPQPDSPTSASTSPFRKEKLTFRTAFSSPCGVSKLTDKFLTSNKSDIPPSELSFMCHRGQKVFYPTGTAIRPTLCYRTDFPETHIRSNKHTYPDRSNPSGLCLWQMYYTNLKLLSILRSSSLPHSRKCRLRDVP